MIIQQGAQLLQIKHTTLHICWEIFFCVIRSS